MKILLAATGDIALPLWDWLANEGPGVAALLTQPDKPQGRRMSMTPPAIKLRAQAIGVPVMQPDSIRKKSAIDAVEAIQADLIVVMAYGQMLPERFLRAARYGCVNLHASLLPKYRGAACIQAAITSGDKATGVTLMHVVKELDAGDIITQRSIVIEDHDTGGSLHDKLADLAPHVLADALPLLESGQAPRVAQNPDEVSYVGKINRDDGRIAWNKPAIEIARLIRAMDPWPGTYTHNQQGQRVKIFPSCRIVDGVSTAGHFSITSHGLTVGTGDKLIVIDEVQPEGGKRMKAVDYARGLRDGTSFSS